MRKLALLLALLMLFTGCGAPEEPIVLENPSVSNELSAENEQLKKDNKVLQKEIDDLKSSLKEAEVKKEFEPEPEVKEKTIVEKTVDETNDTKQDLDIQTEAETQTNFAAVSPPTAPNPPQAQTKAPDPEPYVAEVVPPQQEQPTTEQTVYVTPTGKRYHYKVCGNGNYSTSSLSSAQARGLTACQKCVY